MTVAELPGRMSAYELECWRQLEVIEPWGVKALAKATWLICCSMGCKMDFIKFYRAFCRYGDRADDDRIDGLFGMFEGP